MKGDPRRDGKGAAILVVDDERVVAAALDKILKFEGMTVEVVDSVAAARDSFAVRPFSALITDIMLPGESGEALLKETVVARPEMPIVVITGYGTNELALRVLYAGAFDFLAKPFSFEELSALAARLRRFLEIPLDERIRLLRAVEGPSHSGLRCFSLRGHSWVDLGEDGSARVGVGGLLARTAGEIKSLLLPDPGDALSIGQHCARLVDKEGNEHGVRAPVSGIILDVTPVEKLIASLGDERTFRSEPFFRARPANLALEMASLMPCPREP